MAASAGDVMISADGRIRLKGSIQSNHRVIVQSTSGRIKDSGQTMASGAIIYQSAAGIQTDAQMESGSYVELDAGAGNWTNSGTLFTNGVLLASAGGAGVNSGEINAVKGVAAQFLTARNLGKIESQNSITIQTTGNLTNASQIIGDNGVALISRSGGLTQSGAWRLHRQTSATLGRIARPPTFWRSPQEQILSVAPYFFTRLLKENAFLTRYTFKVG